MRAALMALMAPGAAWAGDTLNLLGTTVRLQPGETAPMELEFYNRNVNGDYHDGWQTLTLDGVDVDVLFTWNANVRSGAGTGHDDSDRIDVVPPDGWVCVPASCRIDVPETQTGRIELFRAGVGM